MIVQNGQSARMRLQTAIEFTEIYQKYADVHPAIREAKCLEVQALSTFQPIQMGDLLAGRIIKNDLGVGNNFLGFYCHQQAFADAIKPFVHDTAFYQKLQQVGEFWKTETTEVKVNQAYPEHLHQAIPAELDLDVSHAAFPLFRMACMHLDFDLLCQQGIVGLQKIINEAKNNTANRAEQDLFTAFDLGLKLLAKICLKYADEAALLADKYQGMQQTDFLLLNSALKNIAYQPPTNFREAIQLFWLYTQIADTVNYGRMDVYLGDFYVNDLGQGTITEAEALRLVKDLWQHIDREVSEYDGRVIIGGLGRRNEKNADQFALLAIQATTELSLPLPQLSLRIHQDQDPLLLKKALNALALGKVHPILYNDEVNIRSVAQSMGVTTTAATQYVPGGCGEITLDHSSVNSPNSTLNILKILNITLRNGIDPFSQKPMGIKTGAIDTMIEFDDLLTAFYRQVRFFIECVAEHSGIEYSIAGQSYSSLFQSLLYDSCIARGKALFDGGVEYLGCTIETYGLINAADSLNAIKIAVFDEKKFTLTQLVKMLDVDFVGYELERRYLQQIPKFGNDNQLADTMVAQVHKNICLMMQACAQPNKLAYCLMDFINVSFATIFGKTTAASADGRKRGASMANANSPSMGQDKQGITACLNSMTRIDTGLHLAAVQNIKFGKKIFSENRLKIEALILGYFAEGGTQLMITVVDKGALEDAVVNPQKHTNLLVRMGGFTSRFIDLEAPLQQEIIARNLY